MTPAGLAKLASLGVTKDDLKAWQRVVGTPDDGDPGPGTFAATVAWRRERGHATPPTVVYASEARARVVARARSYLAPDGQPCARDPNEFFRIAAPDFADRGLERTRAWCGIFALACLVLEKVWPADAPLWVNGKGFVLAAVRTGLMRVVSIGEPGDVVCFGAPLWHYAIVERVEGGKAYTIDGNVMGAVEGCSAKVHKIDAATAFYSIGPLVGEARP